MTTLTFDGELDLPRMRAARHARLVAAMQDHDVAALHMVAIADTKLAHHATGRVLDLLDVGVDYDRPRCDHGAGQLGGRGPATNPDDQQQADDDATQVEDHGTRRHRGLTRDGGRRRRGSTRR